MSNMNWLRMGVAVLAAAGMAGAHLSVAGFAPAAGTTVTVGSATAIKWTELFHHDSGVDIALSTDNGATWTDIKTGFSDDDPADLNTFNWTVAGAATTTAKIRICQHNDGVKTGCTDADNASSLTATTTDGHYVLISSAFTIAAATGIRPVSAGAGFSVNFIPETRNVDVSFGLSESESVLLQAFDTQGRLLATLVQGSFAAGNHKLSLFSNRVHASGNSLIFKLKVGDRVQSYKWIGIK